MNKENQSLIDFLQVLPFSSFMVPRSPISNKEAQALYDIWEYGEKDEYGKYIVPIDVDSMHITSLTSKGYMSNHASRFATRGGNNPTCDFTNKGKDVIQKIILFKEKSAFEKSSGIIDYESICRAEIKSPKTADKIASKRKQPRNWLERVWK